jgi:hypothetical protein
VGCAGLRSSGTHGNAGHVEGLRIDPAIHGIGEKLAEGGGVYLEGARMVSLDQKKRA